MPVVQEKEAERAGGVVTHQSILELLRSSGWRFVLTSHRVFARGLMALVLLTLSVLRV